MKRHMKVVLAIVVISFFIMPLTIYAHPGNTDSSGCHTCRTNCPSWGLDTGEYHCHNSKGVTQPKEPVKSTYGENGTGYTSPAPEYSNSTSKAKKSDVRSNDSGAASVFGGAALIGVGAYALYRKARK